MELVTSSLDTFLATTLAIAVPWLFLSLRDHPSHPKRNSLHTILSLFLLLHTLFILRALILVPPSNIFKALKLPINAPTDTIRAILLKASDDGEIPGHLEMLLTRLGLSDFRLLYVRFGHDVVATCEYCRTFEDFLLFAFPRPLLSYIREMVAVGILTLEGSNRSHMRSYGIGALTIAGLTEAFWILTYPIAFPQRGDETPVYMLHDNLLFMRHMVFLILPLTIRFLPSLIPPTLPIPIITGLLHPPVQLTPSQRATALTSSLKTLEHLLPALHLLKYTHASIMRTPALRERASKWWDEEKKEGTAIRDAEGVQAAARAAGLAYQKLGKNGETEGQLRTSANMAIDAMKTGLPPSEHWITYPG